MARACLSLLRAAAVLVAATAAATAATAGAAAPPPRGAATSARAPAGAVARQASPPSSSPRGHLDECGADAPCAAGLVCYAKYKRAARCERRVGRAGDLCITAGSQVFSSFGLTIGCADGLSCWGPRCGGRPCWYDSCLAWSPPGTPCGPGTLVRCWTGLICGIPPDAPVCAVELAIGDACGAAAAGSPAGACSAAGKCVDGRCVRRVELGGACGPAAAAGPTACSATRSVCDGGWCKFAAIGGELCDEAAHDVCTRATTCVDGMCVEGVGREGEGVPAGGACGYGVALPCFDGLRCDRGRCKRVHGEGQAGCSRPGAAETVVCDTGLECRFGACAAVRGTEAD